MKIKRNKITSNQSGITLIALVITIIVLLILAGVAISMLAGDNGILRRAAETKEKTEKSTQQENTTLGSYEDTINETLGQIPEEKDVKKLETAVSVKTKYMDDNAQNTKTKTAVIPRGFKVSNQEGEQHIDTGLVVIAPDGSEFVWVPVDDISTMYETKTVTQVNGTQKEIKVGKLYNNGDINSPRTWSETECREPAILKDTTNGDAVPETTSATKGIGLLKNIVKLSEKTDNEILGKWEKQLQDEFDEMIRSVEKNKGFYVSRYECSLTDDKTKIQSKKNKTSATAAASSCNTWYGLYQKNKEYSLKNEKLKDVVGSSMIWGSQYDQMMIWMKANGYTVNSTTPKTGISKNTTQTTGKDNNTDIMNNVNDLIGCNYEWTLEASDTYDRVFRRRWLRRWRFTFSP